MEIQNSYIFILKELSTKSSETIVEEFVHALRDALDLLTANITPYKFSTKYMLRLSFEDKSVDSCLITVRGHNDCLYVDADIQGNSIDNVLNQMQKVHDAVTGESFAEYYVPIVSYDSISEHYCNLIFPILNRLERNLRHLFFNVFIVKYGRDYHKKGLSEDIQIKAKRNLRSGKSKSKKDFELMSQSFYSLDFGDFIHVLFDSSWTESEDAEKEALVQILDGTLSSDEQESLKNRISQLGPRTTWERLFSDRIDRDMEEMKQLLDEIRKFRNLVAHSKLISKEQYLQCRQTIEQVDEDILRALEITYEKDFSSQHDAQLTAALEAISKSMQQALGSIASISKLYDSSALLSSAAAAASAYNAALSNPGVQDTLRRMSQAIETVQRSSFDFSKLSAFADMMRSNDIESKDEPGADTEDETEDPDEENEADKKQ